MSPTTGCCKLVCEAMGHGALDAVKTPVLGADGKLAGAAELLAKIESVCKMLRAHPSRIAAQASAAPAPAVARTAADPKETPLPLVAIGASTGGPQALVEIMAKMPADFPAAVVIAQHIGAEFAAGLVSWIGERTPLAVRPARDGDKPARGVVLVAATNDHLVMRPGGSFGYTTLPLENPYRPSVDELFSSIAANWSRPSVAGLLTGMGRDGARGLLELRRAGWFTIAQDQKTSVVYGMPGAAAEIGAATAIVPIEQIAQAIRLKLNSVTPRAT